MATLSGNIVQFSVTFTNASTDALVDPSVVEFSYSIAGGAFTTPWTYASASTPAVGVVARISAGLYEVWVDSTGMSGVLIGKWVSTGTGAASVTDTITIGSASSTGPTFGDLINTAYRRIVGPVQEAAVQINQTGGIGSTDSTVTFSGPQSAAVLPGVKLSCDIEDMFVVSVSGQVATVQRGFGGSSPAVHANGANLYINARVTKFDIAQAINDDLLDMSSVTNGLFRVGTATITYNPVFMGYDLGAIPSNFTHILGVSYRNIAPTRNFPLITEFEVRRWAPGTDSAFPSGNGLIVYQEAYPGLPMQVTYAAPFIPLVLESDSVTNTPVANDPNPPANGYSGSTAPNLASTMTDIPVLGATIATIQPQEIGRNDLTSQPDPGISTLVPATAISSSVNALILRRAARINAEADRLYVAYPDRR